MKIGIPFFPILTDEKITESSTTLSDFSFSYSADGDTYPLTLKPITVATKHDVPAYNLVDERGEWDPIHFSAKITRQIHIKVPSVFFGTGGIAVHDAKVGVAVMMYSLSSNRRNAQPIAIFSAVDKEIKGSFSFVMEKGFYREKISLRTVMFINTAGIPCEDEKVFANLPGTLLGTIDEIAVYLDGTGSLFPVKKESDPAKPLWRVECDWADPYNDLFDEENVCVIFNQAHPNYGLLKIENGMNGSPFLADVIASALQIIITKTIESVGSVEALENTEYALPGSILDAVHYFISTFGWNTQSPEKLAETIRLDFDRRTANDK